MVWTEKHVGNGKQGDLVGDNGFLNGVLPASDTSGSSGQKKFEGKDPLSYANILRSRNKFVDALAIYESILEKDNGNIEAHIGKGICQQMQNMGRLALESFEEAIRLDPHNVCALTHCGILYKDERRLVEAAELHQFGIRAAGYLTTTIPMVTQSGRDFRGRLTDHRRDELLEYFSQELQTLTAGIDDLEAWREATILNQATRENGGNVDQASLLNEEWGTDISL